MDINVNERQKTERFWRGSNSRPSACKADVITTTPQNPTTFIEFNTIFIGGQIRNCLTVRLFFRCRSLSRASLHLIIFIMLLKMWLLPRQPIFGRLVNIQVLFENGFSACICSFEHLVKDLLFMVHVLLQNGSLPNIRTHF